MKINQLERKLIAAARADAPSERVPFAFEQRIMARLRQLPAADAWAYWSRMLWRAAAPCLAVSLAMAAWTVYRTDSHAQAQVIPSLEDAVFASVELSSD